MRQTPIIKALGFSLLATTLMTACGEDSEPQPVNAQTMPQAISQHTESLAQGITKGMEFTSKMSVISTLLNLGSRQSCSLETSYDSNGELLDTREVCEPAETYKLDLATPSKELSKLLKENILIAENIEAQTATEVTYLLKSEHVCAAAENESERGDCTQFLDKMQVRLVVTSPAKKTFNVAVHTGIDKHNPVTISVAPGEVTLQTDLSEANSSLKQLKEALELNELALPKSVSGKLSLEVKEREDSQHAAILSFLSPIRVSDEDYDIKIGSTESAILLYLNENREKLDCTVSISPVEVQFPFYEYTEREVEVTDEDGFTYTEYEQVKGAKHSLQVKLVGIFGELLLDGKQNTIDATNLGLGISTGRVFVDQEEVLSLDLQRMVDLHMDDSGAKPILEIKPTLDLKMIFAFAKLKNKLQDLNLPSWMLNDTLTIKTNGTAPLRIEPQPNDSLKVLAGALTFGSLMQQKAHNIQANQCFGPADDDDVITIGSEQPAMPEDDHIINLFAQRVCK